jgi:hypothetical protein
MEQPQLRIGQRILIRGGMRGFVHKSRTAISGQVFGRS